MKFGVSKQTITPLWRVKLSGYGSGRPDRMEGIHDDLYVRSLLFDDGNSKFLIIVCDVAGVNREYADAIKKEIKIKYSLEKDSILIQPTHSHSSPNLREMPGEKKDNLTPEEKYCLYVKDKIMTCISECFKYTFEGVLEYSSGVSYVSMNRRKKKGDEFVIGANPEGIVDRNLVVLRIKDSEGQLKAIVFNIALHGTVLKYYNMLISGDAPGEACAQLEKKHKGCIAVFMQGDEGNNNPAVRYTGRLDDKITDYDDVFICGKALALDVDDICTSMKKVKKLKIKTKLKTIKLPYEIKSSEYHRNKKGTTHFYTKLADYIDKLIDRLESGDYEKDFTFQTGYIELCPELRIIALEGEVFSEIGLGIRNLFDNEGTIIAGLANGSTGYIPTQKAIEEGGYETESSYLRSSNKPGPVSGKSEQILLDTVKGIKKQI